MDVEQPLPDGRSALPGIENTRRLRDHTGTVTKVANTGPRVASTRNARCRAAGDPPAERLLSCESWLSGQRAP